MDRCAVFLFSFFFSFFFSFQSNDSDVLSIDDSFFSLSVCLVCLSVCLAIYLSVCLSVCLCLSICLLSHDHFLLLSFLLSLQYSATLFLFDTVFSELRQFLLHSSSSSSSSSFFSA